PGVGGGAGDPGVDPGGDDQRDDCDDRHRPTHDRRDPHDQLLRPRPRQRNASTPLAGAAGSAKNGGPATRGDPMTRPVSRRAVLTAGVTAAAGTAGAGLLGGSARAGRRRPFPEPIKVPEAAGRGGAVASVDPYASEVGIQVLRTGGNAVDAAIAMAATLGVTEPFSSGLGGGGFFVLFQARTGKVITINGRETAPASYHGQTLPGR